MTICATVAGILTFAAFVAHAFWGTREFWRFKPPSDDVDSLASWVQGVAGWQFASFDLLISSVLFFLVAFSDIVANRSIVLALMSAYYFLVGTGWLLVVACVGYGIPQRWLKLGQWIFCYVVAVLSIAGAQL